METERKLVNGGEMRNFLNQKIQIFLKVDRLTPGGRQFTGMSSDKKSISVTLNAPLNQALDKWVEVIGTAKSSASVECDEIIVHPEDDISEQFDEESHNHLIAILHNMQNFYEIGETNGFH